MPSLPAYALESEEAVDPLDVASTAQRPAITIGPRSRRVVRKVTRPSADATSEVQVEDILLEVYAEDPPPPPTRRSSGVVAVSRPSFSADDSGPASASIAAAIASIVPAAPAQSAAVDALLRASAPAFVPPFLAPPTPLPFGVMADLETPSVAPVMLSMGTAPAFAPPPVAYPLVENARRRGMSRAAMVAIWSLVLVVVGLVGAAAVLAVPHGAYARVRDAVRGKPVPSVVAVAEVRPAAAVATPPPAPEPLPAPSPSAVPTMSINSLPKAPIAADSAMVTLPAYAQGHRVFFDGRIIAIADGGPTRMRCGRHMLKIGSARKPRVVDLACGREVIVD